MSDAIFVIAAYAVILGAVATYAATLARRLASARSASLRIRREAQEAPLPDDREA